MSRYLYLRLLLSDEEYDLIRLAAKQVHWSVKTWAEVSLTDLANIETNGGKGSEDYLRREQERITLET